MTKPIFKRLYTFTAIGCAWIGLQSFQNNSYSLEKPVSPQTNHKFLVAQIDWQGLINIFGRKKGSGRQRAGYSRPDCPVPKDAKSKLTSLVPISNYGTTTYNNPTFWFYVPYSPDQIVYGEFSLQKNNGDNVISPIPFKILNTPGFVEINTPPGMKLDAGKEYEWSLELYCKEDKSPTNVSGRVERVEISGLQNQQLRKNSNQYEFFLGNGIWFDSVNEIMSNRKNRRSTLSNWEQLFDLSTVNLADLKSIDFFSDITILPNR